MRIVYHPEAEAEFLAALLYYNADNEQAGKRFALEVAAALQLVVAFPEAWPILEDGIRRCLVSRFPYALIYRIEAAGIYIHAVTHLSRRPGYWKHRRFV